VLIGAVMVAGISLASLTFVTSRVVEGHSIARARGDLAAARVAFTHVIATRSELVAAQTRLITSLPVFRAYFTSQELVGDASTMAAMADMFRQDLHAQFTIVSDAKATWLAVSGLPLDSPVRTRLQPRVAETARGVAGREIVAIDSGLYLVVAEPALFADEVLGTLTTGYLLDDLTAGTLAQATHRDVALITDQNVVSGTSLSGAARDQLAATLTAHPGQLTEPGVVSLRTLGDDRFITGSFALGENAGFAAHGKLILMENWTPTQQFVDDIREQLLWTGAGAFAIAIAASLFLSRHMSRPLRELADSAAKIAAGHWDHRISAGGSAEAAAMADAFNDMTMSLSHWHDEARKRADQLQTAYDRFYAVTQSAYDAIVSTDADGVITFWNRRAEAIFGYEESGAIGRRFDSLLSAEGRARYGDAARSLAAQIKGAPEAQTLEGEGLRRDGSVVPIELSLTAWQSDGQRYITAIVRDVTERRKAEALIRLRDQQLLQAQKMEAVGRLASGVAHDFNNSLAVIHGMGEVLLATMTADDPKRADVELMMQASEGAAAVTRRLLAFGRKSTADATRIVDAGDIVTGLLKMLRRLLGEQVNIAADAIADGSHVRIDPGQLEQVLMNLALNARDAMPDGGNLSIEVRSSTISDPAVCHRAGVGRGDYVSIAVRDTGCGMDAETAARIFEPFFTTKEPGRGTGLGLSMVYSIVTQSGGGIEIETAPGRGTTFLLHFPRVKAEEDRATGANAIRTGEETILLVEDQRPIRLLLTQQLKRAGYSVLAAGSADEAVNVAAAHDGTIDLLVTDVMLHGTGGFALSESIAASRPGTKVLFITGYPPGATEREPIDAAGLPCLQKPFSFEVLSRQLRATLEEARAA
jgi:PAS domain S-box-containing protein